MIVTSGLVFFPGKSSIGLLILALHHVALHDGNNNNTRPNPELNRPSFHLTDP